MVRAGFHGRRGCLCVWLELRRRIGSGGGGARCLQSIESPPLTRRGGLAEGAGHALCAGHAFGEGGGSRRDAGRQRESVRGMCALVSRERE